MNYEKTVSQNDVQMDIIQEQESKTVSMKKGEEFEYLFIDMEWNQREGTQDIQNREPIQIGLIGTDENLENIKLFSKYIRLEDVTTLKAETCKMTHTNEKTLMQANTLEDVFYRVKQSFSKYKYVVVWTMSTYELFMQSMNKAGIKMPRHKVLVLQEILSKITMQYGQNLGFETALNKAEISYETSYLHYSKHDVKYMYELFRKMYSEYAELTETESCSINETSKIIHSPDCRYVKHSVVSDVGKKNLIFKGYRPCSYCGTEENWRRIFWEPVSKKKRNKTKKKNEKINYRELTLTDENIELICNHFNIKCHIGEQVIFLTTNCGCWRVYLVGEEVDEVFHGNYRVSKNEFKKKKKWNEGYHKQNISQMKFYDAVRYIYYHDKYSYSSRKKSRVDILLEQIEQDRLIKEELSKADS